MLAYVLALAIGLGSIAIYLVAFFFPEIHRKNDFIWSGVGLFYALVIWVFAQRITGGLLLGHVASVALLYWFGWQTLSLRQQLTPKAQQTPIPSAQEVKTTIQEQVTKLSLPERLAQVQNSVANIFGGVKNKVQQTVGRKAPATSSAPTVKSTAEIIDKRTPISEQPTESTPESVPELIPPNPPSPELVEAAQPDTEAVEQTPPPSAAPNTEPTPPTETKPEHLPPNN
jgi:hypothetical protein